MKKASVWSAVGLVTLALLAWPGRATGQRAAAALRYVANAGVLLTLDGRKILIDAPIRDGIPPYATSSAAERTRLERAQPPYDNVAAILITHWHEDHFSAEAVAAHLDGNANALLISSEEVIARVRAASPQTRAAQLVALTPQPGTASRMALDERLNIHVLRIRHNDTRRMPQEHVGFLIAGSSTVLHVGDADPAPENFAVLKGLPKVDLAVLPFWYVLTDKSRAFVQSAIAPGEIVGMHLPPQDAADVEQRLRSAGVKVRLLAKPGTEVR